MERVHFQREQMLDELKDLTEKGIFTKEETHKILQTRTEYESMLIRRNARKADFLRYVRYEMGVEALRLKRVKALDLEGPHTLSDHSITQRQYTIFERAVKKWKDDLGLWIEYLNVLRRNGANKKIAGVCTRALAMHPTSSTLYIMSAKHELESNHSIDSARKMLQRGIRMCAEGGATPLHSRAAKDEIELWKEYVRLELGFVESMRRRWEVLGIDIHEDADDKGKGKADQQFEQREAQREIVLRGAIVREVISQATQSVPRSDLYSALHEVVSTYPLTPLPDQAGGETTDALKPALLDHLFSCAASSDDSVAFIASSIVRPGLKDVELVDKLHEAWTRAYWSGKHDEARQKQWARWVEAWLQNREEAQVEETLGRWLQATAQCKIVA
ncbi:U3 small nucleolar RNA-associated protein 6-domain-containing protein [Schizophyllum amplum]|uniref:U3 small nucleolar RNA-associated protein 6-domain-containing protein n=1 Tax=Schizophyllum amplum TaxID=97359 RepID=A0A550BUG1_9AGAR|nr:U3 small nucleolar RNA-associated protein 6-domain-containing protein [Auriculariopsis ampla]